MNPFECCHKCVAPKRHPGCGGSCEEYKKAKAVHEAKKQQRLEVLTSEHTVKTVLSKYRPAKYSKTGKVSPLNKQR